MFANSACAFITTCDNHVTNFSFPLASRHHDACVTGGGSIVGKQEV